MTVELNSNLTFSLTRLDDGPPWYDSAQPDGGSSGGGGDPLSGFTADTDFSVTDNGDGTLSITDSQSRFGTKPGGGKPLYVLDFASGTDQPTNLGRNQVTINWSDACYLTTSLARGTASHSMVIDTNKEDGDGSNSISGSDSVLQFDAGGSRKFYRCLVNYNDFIWDDLNNDVHGGPGGVNFKLQRWQTNDLAAGDLGPYTPNVFQGTTYRFMFSDDEAGAYDTVIYSDGEWDTKRWRVEEERHIVSSGPDVADAEMYVYLDGEETGTRTGQVSHRDGDDPAAHPWEHFKMGNFNGWAPSGTHVFHWDLQYIDNSWAKVVITDQASWDDSVSHTVELQIPLSWGESEVDFSLRRHAIDDLSGHYLWVVDDDQNPIRIGGWD